MYINYRILSYPFQPYDHMMFNLGMLELTYRFQPILSTILSFNLGGDWILDCKLNWYPKFYKHAFIFSETLDTLLKSLLIGSKLFNL